METPLHAQKVTILSRLIKDNHLTKDEALLLLAEENSSVSNLETKEPNQVWHMNSTSNSSIIYNSSPYSISYSGSSLTDFKS